MVEKKQEPKERRRGRPSRNDKDVGREALLEAAMRLLRQTEPAAITRQMVATEAGADPNLIRYYFGNMAQLLLEVTVRANRKARAEMSQNSDALSMEGWLRLKIDRTFDLFKDNPSLHRLVTSVLNDKEHVEAQAEWHATLQEAVKDVKDALTSKRGNKGVGPEEPRFLHLLTVSACEFWTHNQKIVENLFGETDGNSEELAERYLAFVTETILHGIGGERASEAGSGN